MGCLGCSTSTTDGSPAGCGSKGNCSTGGCNRMNTYDWLTKMDIQDAAPFDIVEVSFKNGARKQFYRTQPQVPVITGDNVVIDSGNGYDIGMVTLSGELVRLQMKKKKVNEKAVRHHVIRVANRRDMERLQEARSMEKSTMVRARVIARTLDLDMKIGDIEYQGDKRKATFYYTAEGRVDFRELIRHFAKEFRVKIEMRQIGARQESARIGGIGSCGRELCCSTWLSDFKSVSTAAARYQNLAINQTKLSGQCGRLKCCLNYELDTYMDALEVFPQKAEKLKTKHGIASLVKMDIFKQLMFYSYREPSGREKIITLNIETVKQVQEQMEKGEYVDSLMELQVTTSPDIDAEEVFEYEDVTGAVELPMEKRRKKRRNKNRGGGRKTGSSDKGGKKQTGDQNKTSKPKGKKQDNQSGDKKPSGRGGNRRRPNKRRGGGNKSDGGKKE